MLIDERTADLKVSFAHVLVLLYIQPEIQRIFSRFALQEYLFQKKAPSALFVRLPMMGNSHRNRTGQVVGASVDQVLLEVWEDV